MTKFVVYTSDNVLIQIAQMMLSAIILIALIQTKQFDIIYSNIFYLFIAMLSFIMYGISMVYIINYIALRLEKRL
jgi:hypothetical protein